MKIFIAGGHRRGGTPAHPSFDPVRASGHRDESIERQNENDNPAPVSDWLPALAKAIGAPPPLRIPALIARLAIGAHGVSLMNEIRGASNAKAKRELSWKPFYPTWRSGFREGLS